MKENVNWQNQIYEMEWLDSFDKEILKNLSQVYGFLFTEEGKLCIVRPTEKRGWRLSGGGPEDEDEDWKDTIIRESLEEADIILDKESLEILGLIKISPKSKNCEKGIHYSLRISGKIIGIQEQTEDIAEGLVNERLFIEPENFLKYCPWGKLGEHQIKLAKEITFPS